jgi:hypothetical protein
VARAALTGSFGELAVELALPRAIRPLIDDVEGGSALFVRLHHAIGDGIALVRTLGRLWACDASSGLSTQSRLAPTLQR